MLATTIAMPALTMPVTQVEAKNAVVLATNAFKDVAVSNPYYQMIHEM